MKVSKGTAAIICLLFAVMLFASAAFASSYLFVEERIAAVEQKIEAGNARGSLTRNEYSRLKTRLLVVKFKSDKYKKNGTTERQYLELEHELTGLEKDAERLLNNLRRR